MKSNDIRRRLTYAGRGKYPRRYVIHVQRDQHPVVVVWREPESNQKRTCLLSSFASWAQRRVNPVEPRRGQALHRFPTLFLHKKRNRLGLRWQLTRGQSILWSKPAEGDRAWTHEQVIRLARSTAYEGGYSQVIDLSVE